MKLRITKYQETLNGKPIDGYSTEFMLEGNMNNRQGEWQPLQDADQWQRLGQKSLPSDIFKKHNPNVPIGTTLVFSGR